MATPLELHLAPLSLGPPGRERARSLRLRARTAAARSRSPGIVTSETRQAVPSAVRDSRSLHLRRPARRHRHGVRAGRRDDDRVRPRPARARALPRRPHGARAAGRPIPATSPALAALVAEHDVQARRAASRTSTRASSRASRERLAPALLLAPPYEVCATMADKYVAHLFFEEHGIPSPRTWLPGEVPADARYPAARQDPRGLRLAPHLPRRRSGRARRSSSRHTPVESMVQELCVGEEFSIDVFCDLDGRCLNAIARTMIQSKGGESIKGMSILDRELIEHGAARRRDDRHRRPGVHPVLPRARRLAAR